MIFARRYCNHASLLVCWFVCSLCLLISEKKCKLDFHEIWGRCSESQKSEAVNFWEVKVKVQGQNHCIEFVQIIIALPWFEIHTPNFVYSRSTFCMKYDLTKFKMAVCRCVLAGRGLHCLGAFWFYFIIQGIS